MSGVRRVVLEPAELADLVAGGPLPERAFRHLVRVLRLEGGEPVELGDGAGLLVRGLLRIDGRVAYVEGPAVIDVASVGGGGEARGPILVAGLLKPQRFKLVVEKAVELGASALLPAICARSALRPDAAQGEKLAAKWRAIVREAGQQCQRPLLTSVAPPRPLRALLADADADGWPSLRILASTRRAAAPWPLESGGPAVLLVGPEGGLDEAEEDDAVAAGFTPVTLGAFPLRAETAALALLALAADRAAERPTARAERPSDAE
jgi:16S rRNA (uracil1498-N3)-methyltransferase